MIYLEHWKSGAVLLIVFLLCALDMGCNAEDFIGETDCPDGTVLVQDGFKERVWNDGSVTFDPIYVCKNENEVLYSETL